MKTNYDNIMHDIIAKEQSLGCKPKLLLHVCCAPCSSAVLEYISKFFDITIYYYNPNISPIDEYLKRKNELKRFLNDANYLGIKIQEDIYEPEKFFSLAKGLENEVEGGARCIKCYYLRLEETAKKALEGNVDYFTTTLSISPYKKSDKLNEIGSILEEKYGIKYLYSDFKKHDGYKKSIELSREYNLYRQDYCGCIYSKEARENEKRNLNEV